ncbi:MAG: hypothetical protein NC120_02710 [Ruminococcus sp.]|nr:hypothetical protein [Ruminococcus sp.]
MRSKKLLIFICSVLAAALTLAGCGADETGEAEISHTVNGQEEIRTEPEESLNIQTGSRSNDEDPRNTYGNFSGSADTGETEETVTEQEEAQSAEDELYKRAMDHFNSEDYQNAHEIFSELGDYNDSREMAKECLYNLAMHSYDYQTAYDIFTGLGDYKDSREMADRCLEEIKAAPGVLAHIIYVNTNAYCKHVTDSGNNFPDGIYKAELSSSDEESDYSYKWDGTAEDLAKFLSALSGEKGFILIEISGNEPLNVYFCEEDCFGENYAGGFDVSDAGEEYNIGKYPNADE